MWNAWNLTLACLIYGYLIHHYSFGFLLDLGIFLHLKNLTSKLAAILK